MHMIRQEFALRSRHGSRPFLLDLRYRPDGAPKPAVLFVHGFKGFKDWGPFDAMADAFAEAGLVVAKMNLSHNGTTLAEPLKFADLEAFAQNNYLIELDDLEDAIGFLLEQALPEGEALPGRIGLLGHSRGGGLVVVKAAEDARVSKVASWAGVGSFAIQEPPERIEAWRQEGRVHVWNARTEQQMPIGFQFYETLQAHAARLDVPAAARRLRIPLLLVHGTADETVPHSAAEALAGVQPGAGLLLIPEASHTFGAGHPFQGPLPEHFRQALQATASFFLSDHP
jgi:pimeloyl-ACP methyl ester carboxylesterase